MRNKTAKLERQQFPGGRNASNNHRESREVLLLQVVAQTIFPISVMHHACCSAPYDRLGLRFCFWTRLDFANLVLTSRMRTGPSEWFSFLTYGCILEPFLLQLELVYLQLELSCVQLELFCLQWECVSESLRRTVSKEAQL